MRKVAVIIASYNYGSFLMEAIDSVLNQTYQPDEILISDDASTDDTFEIATTYQKKYPHLIKVNRNEKNLGIVRHFNKAVSLTTADYICFLGADNRFRSDYLEKCVEVLDKEEQVAIAYTDFALFGSRAKEVYDSFKEEYKGNIKENFYNINFPEFTEDSKQILLNGNNFVHGSSMYKREAYNQVGGYIEKDDTPEDYNLFLRMIKMGWKAKKVPFPFLEYRQHSVEQANIKMKSQAELKFYKEQVAIKDQVIEHRDADIALLKKQVKDLFEGNKWYEAKMQEKDSGIEWLQNQLEEHKKSIDWLQKKVEEQSKGIEWLQNQLNEQTKGAQWYCQQKEELEKSLSWYKGQEQELQTILSTEMSKVEKFKQELANLKEELHYYKNKSILKKIYRKIKKSK